MSHSFAVLSRSRRAGESGWMVVEIKVQDGEGGSVKGWERKRKRRGRGEGQRVEDKVPESLGMIWQDGWLSKAASSGVVAEGPFLDT